MSPLLSVLQPSPEARDIHRRLAHVLACSRHELLNARAEVWEPGEEPEPRPAPNPNRRIRVTEPRPVRVIAKTAVLAVLGTEPMGTRQIAKAANLTHSTAGNMLAKLVKSGLARNLSGTGVAGRYVKVAE